MVFHDYKFLLFVAALLLLLVTWYFWPAEPRCTCDVRAMPPPYCLTLEFDDHDGETRAISLLQMVDDPKPIPENIVQLRLVRGIFQVEYAYGFAWKVQPEGTIWVDDVKKGSRWFQGIPASVRLLPVRVLPLSEADQTRKDYQDRWLKGVRECPVHHEQDLKKDL